MTNMTERKLSIFSHPGKITVFGLLQDHFHIEAHIGRPICASTSSQANIGPRFRLGPIWGSRDVNQANMEMPMY